MKLTFVAAVALLMGGASAQPPRPPKGGVGGKVSCPEEGGFQGADAYLGKGPKAAPLRGVIGCVDSPIEVTNGRGETSIGTLIYGPMEAGFSNDQLSRFFGCKNTDAAIPGGLDTLLAERLAEYQCGLEDHEVDILDSCGGHAMPYHYHERMTCLYHADMATGHSTRIGTALDGNGIYGKYINGGVVPTDLDACGGRTGITPDSNGKEVYYYVVQDRAPFTVGCFGPVESVRECRDLYETCGDGDAYDITTNEGTVKYDPDCPCYDAQGSNIGAATNSPATPSPTKVPTNAKPPKCISPGNSCGSKAGVTGECCSGASCVGGDWFGVCVTNLDTNSPATPSPTKAPTDAKPPKCISPGKSCGSKAGVTGECCSGASCVGGDWFGVCVTNPDTKNPTGAPTEASTSPADLCSGLKKKKHCTAVKIKDLDVGIQGRFANKKACTWKNKSCTSIDPCSVLSKKKQCTRRGKASCKWNKKRKACVTKTTDI